MSDRSGVGLASLAVLETLETLTAGRPRAYVTSAEAVAGIEKRAGLRSRYGYEVLTDLVRPWIMPVRLVAAWGNFGDRSFPGPAEPEYTSRSAAIGAENNGKASLDSRSGNRVEVSCGRGGHRWRKPEPESAPARPRPATSPDPCSSSCNPSTR